MSKEFFAQLLELSSKNVPFAVATVIHIEGSASAKPGSKAIIDSNGQTVFGWVGGGCAEGAVRDTGCKHIIKRNPDKVLVLSFSS